MCLNVATYASILEDSTHTHTHREKEMHGFRFFCHNHSTHHLRQTQWSSKDNQLENHIFSF